MASTLATGSPSKTKGLLISAYDAGSHRYWRNGLVQYLSEYDWTVIALPARYFSWRIRGNPISLLAQYRAELSSNYDFIIATSMVDLATLKGLVPSLAHVPSLVYFHENQFEYPKTSKQSASIEPQMVNLYTAMSADSLVFNSEFNRKTFFAGCDQLMAKLPDYVIPEISQQLSSKSVVIPVPIQDIWFDHKRAVRSLSNDLIKLVWNHRWEYDKGPDRLLSLLTELQRRNIQFELNVVGEAFRSVPNEFSQIQQQFSKQINVFGYLESVDEYRTLLAQCDVVVSTAIHEFQGVSVMEAVAAGCIPLVPNRLSYIELIPEAYRYDSYMDTPKLEASAAVDKLLEVKMCQNQGLRNRFEQYNWSSLVTLYRARIESLVEA